MFVVPLCLFAQDRQVALFPLWGENEAVVSMMEASLYAAVRQKEGFVPVPFDMAALPPHIPEGGFPPFLSPSLSIELDVPLAITGNVSQDPSGLWLLRLYLWRSMEIRPLINDGLIAFHQYSADMIIPLMLEWLFEMVDVDWPYAQRQEPPPPDPPPPPQPETPAPQPEAPPPPLPQPPPPPQPEAPPVAVVEPTAAARGADRNLVYLGFRVGWNLQMFDPLWSDDGFDDLQWRSFSLASYANVQFVGIRDFLFLGLQLEGIVSHDFGQNALSFEAPVLGRATFRRENSYVALLFGPHLFVPVNFPEVLAEPFGIEQGVRYMADESDRLFWFAGWGYSAGLNMGSRVGAGFFNLGVRWTLDMFSSRRPMDGAFYNRSTITISVGYERAFRRRR